MTAIEIKFFQKLIQTVKTLIWLMLESSVYRTPIKIQNNYQTN